MRKLWITFFQAVTVGLGSRTAGATLDLDRTWWTGCTVRAGTVLKRPRPLELYAQRQGSFDAHKYAARRITQKEKSSGSYLAT
jgi:hypothetical protein